MQDCKECRRPPNLFETDNWEGRSIRRSAIEKINDQALIADIAKKAKKDSARIRGKKKK